MKSSYYLECAIRAALAAGSYAEKALERGGYGELEWKDRNDFCTHLDRRLEKLIIDILQGTNIHSYLAEESYQDGEYLPDGSGWLIDPIDGTVPMVRGKGFGILISLVEETIPKLGVMYFPKKHRLIASEGDDVLCYRIENERRIPSDIVIGEPGSLDHSIIWYECGKGEDRKMIVPYISMLYETGVSALVSDCCTSNAMEEILSGKVHGYIGIGQKPWDIAAGARICEDAGLCVSTIEGDRYYTDKDSLIICVPDIKEELYAALGLYRKKKR